MHSHFFKLVLTAPLFCLISAFTISLHGNELKENNPTVTIDEGLIVNTDRKVYIAGENVLYNLYLIDKKINTLARYPSIGYLIIRNLEGVVIVKAQVKIINGIASGAVNIPDTLKTGYYQVTGYTNFMRNGPFSNFYRSQILIVNRFDKNFENIYQYAAFKADSANAAANSNTLKITDTISSPYPAINRKSIVKIIPEHDKLNKRTKVSVQLKIDDPQTQYADLSISIVEKNLIEQQTAESKDNNGAFLSSPVVNFSLKTDNPVHLAEDNMAELMGRLVDVNGNGIGYHTLFLTSPDTLANFESANTNSAGFFRFPLTDFYNGKDLFIKVDQNPEEPILFKVIFDSKFQYNEPVKPVSWFIDSSLIKYIQRSQDLVKIQKSFSTISGIFSPQKLKYGFPYLYKIPDFRVHPAEYAELKDFQEIAREILPGVKIRKHSKGFTAEILDMSYAQFLNAPPMIFLDGVLIDNIGQIIPLGTKDVARVDIIAAQWIVDHQVLPGIISVTSRNQLWKTLSLDADNIRLKAENYYETPAVSNPNYSILDKESRDPDFRQLLYWKPNVHLLSNQNCSLDFYTSDYAGKYLIKVEGITDQGERVTSYSEMEVSE